MGLITASLKACLSYFMFSSYISFEFAKKQDYRFIYAFLFFSDILLGMNFDITNIFFCTLKLVISIIISEYINQILKSNAIYRLLIGNEGSKSVFIPLVTFTFVDMWF